jgi:2-polyprenyl-6-methoxyphenol hydroxylase-like FAD-dependent oxidoreductase
MQIGIIGGSIAGCSAAALLSKAGYEADVFERSGSDLVGRGGGIGTLPSLIEELRSDSLVDDSFAQFGIENMPFVGKREDEEPYGRTAWSMPMQLSVFQWSELWGQLRSHVPEQHYHRSHEAIRYKVLDDKRIHVEFSNGKYREFDMLIFADGYSSPGRSFLFPDTDPQYCGYVLWRGLTGVDAPVEEERIGRSVLRLSYKEIPGHNVMYLIPGEGPSKEQLVINWAAYVPVTNDELKELMTDREGRLRNGTLPPGTIDPKNEQRLKDLMVKNIPSFYAGIVERTTDSYVQMIYTLALDKYGMNRMCLIGDAGMIAQPFTGSGVFKGYNNIKDLIRCLDDTTDLDAAIEKWSARQVVEGNRILSLGKQMEQAFIWSQPDFAKLEESEVRDWWKRSVTFPENFNYERDQN